MYEGSREIVNTGCLFDKTNAGGRIGLFVFSQEQVIWSNIKIKCDCKCSHIIQLIRANRLSSNYQNKTRGGGSKLFKEILNINFIGLFLYFKLTF